MKFILITICLISIFSVQAESKRIEVYASGQSFWDVEPGDTLSEIVLRLLPSAASQRSQLMQAIVELNPDAFFNHNDPDYLKSKVRLWLPGHSMNAYKTPNDRHFKIRKFSWGYIKTRRTLTR